MVPQLTLRVVLAAAGLLSPMGTSFGAEPTPISCREWVDPQGVVHLKAEDELALTTCWGYVHGRDRAWQIDYLRKTAQGRRSEVLGFAGIKTDVSMRLLNLPARARKLFEKFPEEAKSRFLAYTAGINLGFKAALRTGVPEFRKLGYEPDPWEPHHSLALLMLQAFDQTRKGIEQDLNEEKYRQKFGEDALFLFSPDGNPWDTSILKRGELRETPSTFYARHSTKSEQVAGRPFPGRTAAPAHWLEPLPVGQGSNNWVVSGSRSKTGKAWLANDPHLGLYFPPFWYWVHLSGGGLEVTGASLPGTPIVASGANLHMAWGLTNSYFDLADVSAVPETELKDAVTSRPLIWVRWWKVKLPFFFKEVRETKEGLPILPIDSPPGKAYVMRWTGFLMEASDLANFHLLMKGRDVSEMFSTLKRIRIPSWNFVFADTQGGIGFRVTGHLPKMKPPKNFGIPERSAQDLKTWPMLEPDEVPAILNPARGFVASANNRQWPKESLHHGGRAYDAGFRAFRIEELLNAKDKHDYASHVKIQCDVQSPDSRFFVPLLVRILGDTPMPRIPVDLKKRITVELGSWDHMANLDCTACPIYRRWMDLLKEQTSLNEGALYRFMKSPRAEELAKTLEDTLEQTIQDLKIAAGTPLPRWRELHAAPFAHLSRLADFAIRETLPTSGDDHSVNPGSMDWLNGSWIHDGGASQRMIVEMTSPPTVHASLAGPNLAKKHPGFGGPKHAWQSWADCKPERRLFPLDWSQVPATELRLAR